jgi:hypothetical protein
MLAAGCALLLVSFARGEGAPLKREMTVHKVSELGLEVWTEANPPWDTALAREPGAPRPIFSVETPGQTYPPAGMTFAVPGLKATDADLQKIAMGALRQAASNYGLNDAEIRKIALKPATYGQLSGFEAEFPARQQDVKIDVRVFFGHRPGKPLVAMQIFTLRGKLPHLAQQIRRSWGNVSYLK